MITDWSRIGHGLVTDWSRVGYSYGYGGYGYGYGLIHRRCFVISQTPSDRPRINREAQEKDAYLDGEFTVDDRLLQEVLHGDLRPVPLPIPGACFQRVVPEIVTAAYPRLPHGMYSQMADHWRAAHSIKVHEHLPRIDNDRVRRRCCWEAGRCICSAPGSWLAAFRRRALASMKERFKEDACRRPWLRSGWIVWRLSAAGPEAPPPLWLHLALMYEKPYRCTFLRMSPDPVDTAEDGPPTRVTLETKVTGDACDFCTMWEAFEGLDLDLQWSLRFYKLVASALPTATVLPGRVQATLLDDDVVHDTVFWRGPGDKPGRRRRRKPGRGADGRFTLKRHCNCRTPLSVACGSSDFVANVTLHYIWSPMPSPCPTREQITGQSATNP